MSVTTPKELGRAIGVDPKRIRAWLREIDERSDAEQWQRWQLDDDLVAAIRQHFAPPPVELPDSTFDARSLTVGQLLLTYNAILAELRRRSVARTNNAPIGDLAEYASAIVYGGELAPNSEKSFDLIAADERRIQVKVRNLRDETRASAAFSVIRSFDFDACAFLLVNDEGVVSAHEWTVEEVKIHGRFVAHVNGVMIRIRQVRAGTIGTDITEQTRAAWTELMSLGSPDLENAPIS